MKRVDFSRFGIVILVTLSVAVTGSAQEPKKPNIVVMMVDNLGTPDPYVPATKKGIRKGIGVLNGNGSGLIPVTTGGVRLCATFRWASP